jgi:cytochrome b6-f complex iron-sulfur subunit
MKRRNFLKGALALLGATSLASLVYPLFKYLTPSASAERSKTLIIAKRDIPLGDAKEIVFNNIPAVVLNRPGKGLIAVSRVCTHLGCLVQYDKENKRLLCPCHAGVYDLEGNIVSGPPPKPLPKLPLRVEGETIVIG